MLYKNDVITGHHFNMCDYINGSKIQWSWDIHFWQNQVVGFFHSWCLSCFTGNLSSFSSTWVILLSFLRWGSGLSFQQLAFWCPLLLQKVQRVFGIQTCLPLSFFHYGVEILCRVSFLINIGFPYKFCLFQHLATQCLGEWQNVQGYIFHKFQITWLCFL